MSQTQNGNTMTHTRLNKIEIIGKPNNKEIKPEHCYNCGIILSRHGRPNNSGFCYNCINNLRHCKSGRELILNYSFSKSEELNEKNQENEMSKLQEKFI